jgi:hypothetical protein
VRVEPHAGAQFRLLHEGGVDGVPPRAKLGRDGCVVHAQQRVAGVEEQGARAQRVRSLSHGRYNDIMRSRVWLSARALALGAGLMPAAAGADHSGTFRAEPLSPLLVAALAAALTLLVGLLVLVVVMRLIGRGRPARDRTDPT